MVTKIYQEIVDEEKARSDENTSFTLKKFYEKNTKKQSKSKSEQK